MSVVVTTMSVELEEIPEQQVYRYMGLQNGVFDEKLVTLVQEMTPQFLQSLQCKICYCVVPLEIIGNTVTLSSVSVKSKDLARNLHDCAFAVLFAATLGMPVEQQRRRAAVISPLKALVLDAMGSAAIEACCNKFCDAIAKPYPEYFPRPRFSPGYGDFPIDTQEQLLSVLDASRKIGLTLSEGMLMIPQKSVTAVMGFGRAGCMKTGDCENCGKQNCEFRR